MSFHIRPAVPVDGPGIARVRVTTWRKAYQGIIDQNYLDRFDIDVEGIRWCEYLGRIDASRCVFVAELDQDSEPGLGIGGLRPKIAGYCMAGPNRDSDAEYSGELYAIYVLPAYHGQGIGRALFNAASAWLAEKGHAGMILFVLRDNDPSRRFYEAMGGTPIREQMIEIGDQLLPEVGYGYRLENVKEK